VMYNLISRGLEEEYVAFAAAYGVSSVVYNPLAGGLLTGKHRPESAPTEGSRFTKPEYRERYWTPAQFAAVERLRTVAARLGSSLVAMSLSWLLSREVVDAVIVGASSTSQLQANIDAAMGPVIDADATAACDEVWAELRGPTPRYNR
jgi:aryl-alcohol dehydrogenase-like predicted oxidoreductase